MSILVAVLNVVYISRKEYFSLTSLYEVCIFVQELYHPMIHQYLTKITV